MTHEIPGYEPASPRIGLVIALPQEARMFARDLPDPNEVARIDQHLLLCVGGVGPVRAQSAAQLLLGRGASALVSWGVAAALVPDLKSGSVLLPRAVIGFDGAVFPVDSTWHERLLRIASFDARPIAEARSVLATSAAKRALCDAAHAAAADMESASVARVARQAGVPFLIVRAIADDCEMAMPTWLLRCMDARGQVRIDRFLGLLLRHPHDFVAVARVARAFAAAKAGLTRFKAQHLLLA
jgi:adenosylhomocysteine nucleosidase